MIRRVFRYGILLLCASLLWLAVDWQETARLLRAADVRLLVGAVLLLTLQTVLSAMRWRLTAGRLGIQFSFGHALREYYQAQALNLSLPGGVIGDASRAVRSKGRGGLRPAAEAVIFERLAGQVGLVAIFALGVAVCLVMPGLHDGPEWFAPYAATLLTAAVLVTLVPALLMRRFDLRLPRGHQVWSDFRMAVCAASVWRRQVALSLGTALCNVAAFMLCAWSVGVSMSILSAISLVPLILFAMLLPFTVSGWGLREGAAAALFPLWGSTSAAGLAASVAFGIMILASILPFFLVGWFEPRPTAEQDGDLPSPDPHA